MKERITDIKSNCQDARRYIGRGLLILGAATAGNLVPERPPLLKHLYQEAITITPSSDSVAASADSLLTKYIPYSVAEAAPLSDEETQNVTINETTPTVWFHPMSETGEVWSYGYMLRDPALYGTQRSLKDTGNRGELFLVGNQDVGLDLQTDTRYLADYQGNGQMPALWLETGPKDTVILMNADNLPVTAVSANDKGFAGILVPNADIQFGLRVIRTSGKTDAIKVKFGNISKEDYADTSKRDNPSIINAEQALKLQKTEQPVVPVQSQPETPKEASQATELPSFLAETPVSTFQEAPTNAFFLAQSMNGQGWSHGVEFAVPNHDAGVFYRDNGEVGKIFIQTRDRKTASFILTMRINPLNITDYKQGGENRPAMWIKTQPTARVELLDASGHVVASAIVDGAGYGGLVLPEFQTIMGAKITLPHPEIDTDTQLQFGPEKPADKGKASTLDSTQWLRP